MAQVGITFLKGKGVLAHEIDTRDVLFNYIRNPASLLDPIGRKKYEAAQKRLLRLVSQTEETRGNTLPPEVHSWSVAEFPGYKPENVFFLKHPPALSQRYQLSGLCYMHGPAMTQHYALAHNNHQVPMIDLLKFIKEHFTAKQLEKHIFSDEGGDSSAFLRGVLQPNSVLVSSGIPIDNYQNYGPGLVSRFAVHDDFMDSSIRKHYGKPSGSFVGWHAMTFVGHREDAAGAPYFLLQNWWKKKQFVEVDADYLEQCGASFTFIKTPQTAIPENFAQYFALYSELECVDKPEGQANEMASE